MWEDRYIFVCMTTPPPSLNSIKLREYYLTLTWVCIFELSYYNISNTSYQCTINCYQKKHTKMCSLMLWFILHDQSGVYFCSRECRWIGWINYRKEGWFKRYILLRFGSLKYNRQHFFTHDETSSKFTEIVPFNLWTDQNVQNNSYTGIDNKSLSLTHFSFDHSMISRLGLFYTYFNPEKKTVF